MIIFWTTVAAGVLVLALILRYIYKSRKPKEPVPVCKHAVWPLPPDRPGAYVNDEPTVYYPATVRQKTVVVVEDQSSNDLALGLALGALETSASNNSYDPPSYDPPSVDTSSSDTFGGFDGGDSGGAGASGDW